MCGKAKISLMFVATIGSLWAQWEVVDSVTLKVRIPAESSCYVYCDYSAESLCVVTPPGGVI